MRGRSFLKTAGAMLLTLAAPALALAGFKRNRLVVNGAELPFPREGMVIDIDLVVPETIGPIVVRISGSTLRIVNQSGPAVFPVYAVKLDGRGPDGGAGVSRESNLMKLHPRLGE